MAMRFAADGDYILVASGPMATRLGGDGCLAVWFYPTDDAARQNLIVHTGASGFYQIEWRADQAGDPFNAVRDGTTDNVAQGAAANFTAYGLNKWLFIAYSFSIGANAHLYMGDLGQAAAPPSSYVAQNNGATVGGPTAADLYIGNSSVTTREFHGTIFWAGVFFRYITRPEVVRMQYESLRYGNLPAGCVLSMYPNRRGRIFDESGNFANGTIGGVPVVAQMPLGQSLAYRYDPRRRMFLDTIAAVGRTALNTRAFPLGTEIGMSGWRMPI